jgi:hypothetical protein
MKSSCDRVSSVAATIVLGMLLSLVVTARPAAATPVYIQPAVEPPQRFLFSSSMNNHDGTGFININFDNFTFSETQSITTVRWQGAYVDNSNDPPNTRQFVIQVYTDLNGSLLNLLDPPNIVYATPLEAHETLVDVLHDFSDPEDFFFHSTVFIYDYEVDLATPLLLAADTQYWLGIYADLPIDAQFDWYRMVGAGGDGSTRDLFEDGQLVRPFDAAFELDTADAVTAPEPASLTLLSAGLIACCFKIRRRRGGLS